VRAGPAGEPAAGPSTPLRTARAGAQPPSRRSPPRRRSIARRNPVPSPSNR